MDELARRREAHIGLVTRALGISAPTAAARLGTDASPTRTASLRAINLHRDVHVLPHSCAGWQALQDEATGELHFMSDVDPADSAPVQ